MKRDWRAVERRLARRLKGKRTALSGAAGGSDIETPWCAVELKVRRALPRWLTSAVERAVREATDQRLPLVILHVWGQRHDDDIVITKLKHFEEWYGPLEGVADDDAR
jgi:hypothetical protein